LQIDFHAVGAITGLKAPATRMRSTRLKKNIDASSSIPAHSGPTNGKRRGTVIGGIKTNMKKRKIEKQIDSANQKIVAGSKANIQSIGPEFVPPSAPAKRQTRGKKIDVSAAFESDTPPIPGSQIRQGDDTSDYEDDQATGEEEFRGELDSVHMHPAKQRRSSTLEKEMIKPDRKRKMSFNERSPSVAESDLNEPILASATALPHLSGIALVNRPFSPFTTHQANENTSLTAPHYLSKSDRTILQTPTQTRIDPTSTHPTQFAAGYPTPPNSNNNSSSTTAFQPHFA
jgi:hypothetical protein